jgi:GNAT superfamily N-acetyltransferase
MKLRTAVPSDVPRLAALNRDAYPDLAADGVVFDAEQLAAHQRAFSAGQLVAEEGGAMATLVVPSRAALAQHSWSEITGRGLFETHEPGADALYLADVYVDPRAWGRGVGQALYAGLWELCRRGGQARVVAGGRLWGYHEVADRLTPGEYVSEVVRGARRDKVLTSQLRAGFVVEGILQGYLEDWRSESYATLLVWTNRAVVGPATRRSAAAGAATASR